MTTDFTLDIGKLTQAMKQSPEAVGKGATTAMYDIKDDWVREARDIAPIDTGNLRRQIIGDVKDLGKIPYVEVEANATQDTGGKRFNYAYYIHEMDAGGRQLRTPGTVKKFLDVSVDNRKSTYEKWLREEIENALKREGW